jgi:hypothetical protein
MTHLSHPAFASSALHLTNTVNRELTNSRFDTSKQEPALRSRAFPHPITRLLMRTSRKPG